MIFYIELLVIVCFMPALQQSMRKEEIQVLEDIQRIEKNQGLLLERAKSPQQELFHLYAHRHLLSQKMMHKHLDEVLSYLPGSFAYTAIHSLHLSVCLEMKVELNPEDHPLLKRLLEWTDSYDAFKELPVVLLMQTALPAESLIHFESYQFYLIFLNFVGVDLMKLIRKSKTEDEQSTRINMEQLNLEDLINFLMSSLPKTLFNIILNGELLPNEFKKNHQSMQILFRAASYEYFLRSKPYYAALIKTLVKLLVKCELKPTQQKQMMEIVYRYFYAFHHDKKYEATSIFIEAYNALHDSVRFAMADQFILFMKIIKKVGKGKFVDFLLTKSPWLKQIHSKVSDNNYVGYAKEGLNPFPSIRIFDTITVPNGKIQVRTFQILQDYSLFYFQIDIPSKDITLRLNYLGEFQDERASKVELLCYEKRSGIIKASIMAAKKGLYQFQFDNTYSWINNKTIKFEKLVLSPIEFQSENDHKWTNNFYDNIPANEQTDKTKIFLIKKAPPPKPEIEYDAIANITKVDSFFNLKLGKGTVMYQFQTENEDKLVKKFNELMEKGEKIKWMVAGEPLDEPEDIKKALQIGNKKEKKENLKTEQKQKQQNRDSPSNIVNPSNPSEPKNEEGNTLPIKKTSSKQKKEEGNSLPVKKSDSKQKEEGAAEKEKQRPQKIQKPQQTNSSIILEYTE